MKSLNTIAGYLAAVLIAYILGAAFVSQGNISAVVQMGFEISAGQRLEAFIHDVTHMYDIYLPLIAIGMLIGLSIAGGIIRFTPNLRLVGYVSAGFVAMISIHLLLKAALGLTGIAPTRELSGLIAQGIAGAFGGYMFHWLTNKLSHE